MADARRWAHIGNGRALIVVTVGLMGLPLAACDSFLSGDRDAPAEARVTIQGDAGTTLRLVTSSSFEQFGGDDGGVALFLADTALVAPPFAATFAIDPLAARFFARLSNEGEGEPSITMQVFFDQDLAYDNRATIAPGSFMEYSKVFRIN